MLRGLLRTRLGAPQHRAAADLALFDISLDGTTTLVQKKHDRYTNDNRQRANASGARHLVVEDEAHDRGRCQSRTAMMVETRAKAPATTRMPHMPMIRDDLTQGFLGIGLDGNPVSPVAARYRVRMRGPGSRGFDLMLQ